MGLQKKRKIRDYETAANQRDARAHTKYGSAGHFLFHSFHRWLFPETKPTHRRCLSDFNCLVSVRVRKNVTTNSSTDCFFFLLRYMLLVCFIRMKRCHPSHAGEHYIRSSVCNARNYTSHCRKKVCELRDTGPVYVIPLRTENTISYASQNNNWSLHNVVAHRCRHCSGIGQSAFLHFTPEINNNSNNNVRYSYKCARALFRTTARDSWYDFVSTCRRVVPSGEKYFYVYICWSLVAPCLKWKDLT